MAEWASAQLYEEPGHYAVRNFCSPEEYTMYCAVLFYKFVSIEVLSKKMRLHKKDTTALLRKLELQKFVHSQERIDQQDGQKYTYYYADIRQQLKAIKFKLHKMRKAAEEGEKQQNASEMSQANDFNHTYECPCGKKFTELDAAQMMGTFRCTFCGKDLVRIDRTDDMDSRIAVKRMINEQLSRLDAALTQAERVDPPPLNRLIGVGQQYDPILKRSQQIGGGAQGDNDAELAPA